MTHPFAHLPFARMNGAGNEIVVLDLRGTGLAIDAAIARAIGRGPRLHFDQLMVLGAARAPGTQAFVTIWNIDGSQAGACGNGMRCVAYRLGLESALLETGAGVLACTRQASHVFTVDMGAPKFGWTEIPLAGRVADSGHVDLGHDLPAASMVGMGNPHAVFFLDESPRDLANLGPLLEHDKLFPDRANISFARVRSRNNIELDVWERGAGLTLACGSAACATLVAAVRRGLCDRLARVTLPGGELSIEWRESDGHVLMTGPVELEFEGRLDPALFA